MIDNLKADVKQAMRDKDKVKLNTLRGLISALQYEEMQKKAELSSDQVLAVLKNELKKRTESLEFAQKDSRQDEIEILQQESNIIKAYLPAQLSEEKLTEILNSFKSNNPEANMGQAMQFLKTEYPGQYDGKLASGLAKSIL